MADAQTPGTSEGFEASLQDLRGSLKWLVAALGATAVILVAGLQFRDLAQVTTLTRGVLATAAAALALVVVLLVLLGVARVLLLPRLTATDLANREFDARAHRVAPGYEDHGDELIAWIHARRIHLLGGAQTVTELYTGGYAAAYNALTDLDRGEQTTWRGHALTPGEAQDRALVHTGLLEVRHHLQVTEAAAHLHRTETAVAALVSKYPLLATVFLACIVTFALATSPSGTPQITAPAPVTVVVTDRAASGLPDGCPAEQYAGVATGGSWEQPRVLLTATSGCPGHLIAPGQAGIIVVPDAAGTDPAP